MSVVPFKHRNKRASCEVRMQCNAVTHRDRVTTIELWGELTVDDALSLVAKTLHCAQRAAYDIHGGETVSVHIMRNGDDE